MGERERGAPAEFGHSFLNLLLLIAANMALSTASQNGRKSAGLKRHEGREEGQGASRKPSWERRRKKGFATNPRQAVAQQGGLGFARKFTSDLAGLLVAAVSIPTAATIRFIPGCRESLLHLVGDEPARLCLHVEEQRRKNRDVGRTRQP